LTIDIVVPTSVVAVVAEVAAPQFSIDVVILVLVLHPAVAVVLVVVLADMELALPHLVLPVALIILRMVVQVGHLEVQVQVRQVPTVVQQLEEAVVEFFPDHKRQHIMDVDT
jgi:hypothetical protein